MNSQSNLLYSSVTPNYGLKDEYQESLKEKEFEEQRSELARYAYRPEGFDKSLQVVYLTLVIEGHSPLTNDEEKVLKTAQKVNDYADYWLNKVFTATACVLLFSGIVTLYTTFKDSQEAAIESSIEVLCAALIVQIGTYYFTGIVPHQASEASNERQDVVDDLEEKFKGFAFELLQLASSGDKGYKVAENCNVEHIKEVLLKYLRSDEVNKILEPFEDVVRTILSGFVPQQPLMNCGYRLLQLEKDSTEERLKEYPEKPALTKAAEKVKDSLATRGVDLSRRFCPQLAAPIDSLEYYIFLAKDSSVFTEEEEEVFSKAQEIDSFINQWLRAVHYFTAAAQGTSGVGLIISSVEGSEEASLKSTTLGLTVTIVTQLLNYYMTGIGPHRSSEYGNMKQNHLHVLKDRFLNMSVELLKVYDTDKDLGNKMADRISVVSFRTQMKRLLGNQEIDMVFKPFEETVGYIRRGVLPKNLTLQFLVRVQAIEANIRRMSHSSSVQEREIFQQDSRGQSLARCPVVYQSYFPSGESTLVQLAHLSSLSEEGEVLTKEETDLFQLANRVGALADISLWPVFWVTTSALALSGGIAVATVMTDNKWYAFESNIFALVASLGTQISSYYFTGIVPHQVSKHANTAQDYKKIIASRFESLAIAMRGSAVKSTNAFVINASLVASKLKKVLSPEEIQTLIRPLEEMEQHIAHGNELNFPLLYLDRKIDLIESCQSTDLSEVVVI